MYFSIAPEEFSFKFLSFKIANFVQYLDVSRQMNSNVSSLRFAQGGELHIWIFPRKPFRESTAPGRGEGNLYTSPGLAFLPSALLSCCHSRSSRTEFATGFLLGTRQLSGKMVKGARASASEARVLLGDTKSLTHSALFYLREG